MRKTVRKEHLKILLLLGKKLFTVIRKMENYTYSYVLTKNHLMRIKIITVVCLLTGILIFYKYSSKEEISEHQKSSMYDIISSEKLSNENLKNQKITYDAVSNSKYNNINNDIVILGKSDDPGVFKRPNFINDTYLFGKPHQDLKKDVQKDEMTAVLTNINEPLFMEFCPSGDKKFYRTRIFITPNDTIEFEVKEKKIIFTGKNAAQNNLFTKLELNTPDYGKSPYDGNLDTYKEKIEAIYNQKKDFVQNYVSKHKLLPLFITSLYKHLEFEYYNNLINPRYEKSKTSNLYYNKPDILLNLIHQESFKRETPFDLNNYLDHITIENFKDSEALRHSFHFKNTINAIIRNHFETSDHPAYSREKMIAEKNYIENNLEGDVRNYAIGRMIRDYYVNGFAYDDENRKYMLNLIEEYSKTIIKKDSYIDKMQEIKEDILTYDFKLSESALNAKMVNHLGDTITLKTIFNRSDKRIKVIDFWASWCPPCIKQIQENKPFKDRLSVENNVEWIYLSIDSDKEKWLKKGEQLNGTLHFRNSYLLLKGKKSSLARALNVHQIPRYLIVDQKNKIVVNNAPTPTNKDAFEKIIDSINPNSALLTSNY